MSVDDEEEGQDLSNLTESEVIEMLSKPVETGYQQVQNDKQLDELASKVQAQLRKDPDLEKLIVKRDRERQCCLLVFPDLL